MLNSESVLPASELRGTSSMLYILVTASMTVFDVFATAKETFFFSQKFKLKDQKKEIN